MLSGRKRKPVTPRTGAIPAVEDAIHRYSYTPTENNNFFGVGDLVQHNVMDYLNNGIPLRVLETEKSQVLCSYTDHLTNTPTVAWYHYKELKLVHIADDLTDS